MNNEEIIDYLNELTGKNFELDGLSNYLLNKLHKEGYTPKEIKKVIKKKYLDWKDTEWNIYIRPETLFGSKFKKYLNEQPRIAKSGIFKLAKAVGEAKQSNWKLDS